MSIRPPPVADHRFEGIEPHQYAGKSAQIPGAIAFNHLKRRTLTSYALSSNLEVAVLLGRAAAEEAQTIAESIITERLAYFAFSTIQT